MTRLLSPSAMRAIQSVGEQGMIDVVNIYRQTVDVGLDDSGEPYGSSTGYSTTVSSTVNGWLVGSWSRNRESDAGDLNTTTVYRLRLPVGTAIDSGDKVEINSNIYFVVDAGTDQTWPEWLTCIVRRSK